MKLILLGVLLILPLLGMAYPKLSPERQTFVSVVNQYSQAANAVLAHQRQQLEHLAKRWKQHHLFTKEDLTHFHHFLVESGLPSTSDYRDPKIWQQLLNRIDEVPNSLVIAQAINETGWGTSRFALEGNNFFGHWCYTKGCGIVPRNRAAGKHQEVKHYPTPLASVIDYLNTINTKGAYRELRKQRAALRKENKPLDSLALAGGLRHYSALGEQYVKLIRGIISHYQLRRYDE